VERRDRCGACAGCTAVECGTCKECLDKPRHGGKNLRRQVCVRRLCLTLNPLTMTGPKPQTGNFKVIATAGAQVHKSTDADSEVVGHLALGEVRYFFRILDKHAQFLVTSKVVGNVALIALERIDDALEESDDDEPPAATDRTRALAAPMPAFFADLAATARHAPLGTSAVFRAAVAERVEAYRLSNHSQLIENISEPEARFVTDKLARDFKNLAVAELLGAAVPLLGAAAPAASPRVLQRDDFGARLERLMLNAADTETLFEEVCIAVEVREAAAAAQMEQ